MLVNIEQRCKKKPKNKKQKRNYHCKKKIYKNEWGMCKLYSKIMIGVHHNKMVFGSEKCLMC